MEKGRYWQPSFRSAMCSSPAISMEQNAYLWKTNIIALEQERGWTQKIALAYWQSVGSWPGRVSVTQQSASSPRGPAALSDKKQILQRKPSPALTSPAPCSNKAVPALHNLVVNEPQISKAKSEFSLCFFISRGVSLARLQVTCSTMCC